MIPPRSTDTIRSRSVEVDKCVRPSSIPTGESSRKLSSSPDKLSSFTPENDKLWALKFFCRSKIYTIGDIRANSCLLSCLVQKQRRSKNATKPYNCTHCPLGLTLKSSFLIYKEMLDITTTLMIIPSKINVGLSSNLRALSSKCPESRLDAATKAPAEAPMKT